MKWAIGYLAVLAAGVLASVAVANPAGLGLRAAPKVKMCHLTAAKRLQTISVTRRSVRAHLRRGDRLGACPRTRTVTVTEPGTTVTITVTAPTTTSTSTSTSTSTTTTTTPSTTTGTTTTTTTTG